LRLLQEIKQRYKRPWMRLASNQLSEGIENIELGYL
jgi:hypothetical protein